MLCGFFNDINIFFQFKQALITVIRVYITIFPIQMILKYFISILIIIIFPYFSCVNFFHFYFAILFQRVINVFCFVINQYQYYVYSDIFWVIIDFDSFKFPILITCQFTFFCFVSFVNFHLS
jgi:hypothetical protein